MSKRFLILGANPETAGLVQTANSMGIETHVADYNPNSFAKNMLLNRLTLMQVMLLN